MDTERLQEPPQLSVLPLILGIIVLGLLLLSFLLAILAYRAEGGDLSIRLTSEQMQLLGMSGQTAAAENLSIHLGALVELQSRVESYAVKDQSTWGELAAELNKIIQVHRAITRLLWDAFFLSFGIMLVVATLDLATVGLSRRTLNS